MSKKLLTDLIVLTLVFGVTVCGCIREAAGPVYVKNGRTYGTVKSGLFRHRWWNYFERGLSYAEGEYYQNAISDFQEAIRQRKKDQRRARTYGMHFIDYFPHRELGIVYFEKGKLQAAKMELELSLSQFPSAKAQFYLDRVRKQLIEAEVKEFLPPKLNLDIKAKTIWTRADPVILAGSAEDVHFIKTIKINGVPIFLERSQKQVDFQKKLVLAQGRHVVDVEAYNVVGGRASQQVTIVVDREGPMISLEHVTVKAGSSGKQITLAGSLYDQAGVVDLRINGRQLSIKAGIEVSFTYQLSTDADELEFIGGDRLGNNTTARISLTDLRAADDNRVIYAGLSSAPDNFLQARIFGSPDTRPPDIIFKGWTESQTVYLEKAYLEGLVQDEHDIVGLEINGKSILKRQGKLILFSQFIELAPGENQILIRAGDEKGN
ncbi:MAG: hypothetical protein KJP23_29420, partial [Deltaproteobacteria bacterium]|nr:hypothetical protein [Deltaproteobacteria bacterium]